MSLHLKGSQVHEITISREPDLSGNFICNGVNDHIEFQAAVDYINNELGTGVIRVKEGTYVPADTITLYDNITLDLGQAVISWAVADTWLFQATGTVGANSALAVQGDEGDRTVQVLDASNWAVGDFVRVRQESISWGQNSKDGEIWQVRDRDVGTDILTLAGALHQDYTLANTATADVVNMVEGIRIYGGRIIGPSPDNSPGDNYFCMEFDFCSDLIIKDLVIETMDDRGIALNDCVNVVIDGYHCFNIRRTGLGYGVVLGNACNNILITDCFMRACRHCIATGTSGGGGANYGIPINQMYSDNTFLGCTSTAIDNHEGAGDRLTIKNNLIIGTEHWGIAVGARRWKVENNEIYHCLNGGIGDRGDETREAIVTNNLVVDTKYGVLVDGNNLEKVVIDGLVTKQVDYGAEELAVSITGQSDTDIYVSNVDADGNSAGTALIGISTGAFLHLSNCVVRNSQRSGISLSNISDGQVTNCTIFNNNQADSGTISRSCGIYLDNCDNLLIDGNSIFDNQGGSATQRYGVYEASGCNNNRITNNLLYGNVTEQVHRIGTATDIHVETFQFTEAVTGSISTSDPIGIDVDQTGEQALVWGQIPHNAYQVLKLKIWAVATGTPEGAGGQMHCQFTFNAGASNAPYNTASKSWDLVNHDSEEADYVANDVVHWVIEDGDVGSELLSLVAGDSFQLRAIWETASNPDGSTDARFRVVEVEYV